MMEYNYIPRPGELYLSKNTEKKTLENAENNKIYQLVITHILMCMIQ